MTGSAQIPRCGLFIGREGYFTVCDIVPESLPVYAADPANFALTLYFPALSAVVMVATPEASRAPVPTVVLPAMKLTVPAGGPAYDGVPVTVAVNVTDWPALEGFGVELIVVTVVPRFTAWVNVAEALPLYSVSPA